jgi:hypothetical protein
LLGHARHFACLVWNPPPPPGADYAVWCPVLLKRCCSRSLWIMKHRKCADGLRNWIGRSETSVRNLLGEISRLFIYLFIYLFICCLFKDAISEADCQCLASNKLITVDKESETTCEKTVFMEVSLLCCVWLEWRCPVFVHPCSVRLGKKYDATTLKDNSGFLLCSRFLVKFYEEVVFSQ